MAIYVMLAFFAGLAGVIQNGLNRKMTETIGLGSALQINNIVVFILGLLVLTGISLVSNGEFAQLLKLRAEPKLWNWWFIIPGLLGLCFVVIMPFTILRIGAVKVFIAVIFAQIIGSLLWDKFIENLPVDKWRLIGSLLAAIGAVIVTVAK